MTSTRTHFSSPAQIALQCLLIVSANIFLSFAAVAQVASGLDSTESSTAFPSDSTTVQLFADSTYSRWRMNNHNRGAQLVGAWPCTSAGCMIYADTNAVNTNVYPEKVLNHPGTMGNVLLTASMNTPGWSAWTMPTTVCGNGLGVVSDGTNIGCTATILPVVSRLTSDQSNSTTSFNSLFSFTMAANTSYTMSCDLVYQASATSGGLRLEFTGPATPTNVIYGGYLYKAPGVQEMAVATLYSTSLFGTPFTVSASGTNYISHISATIENGANAGALILLFANIDTSTVKVLRGSWCHVF